MPRNIFFLLAAHPEARVHSKIIKKPRHPNKFFLRAKIFLHLALSYLFPYDSQPPVGFTLHPSPGSPRPLSMFCFYLQDLLGPPSPKTAHALHSTHLKPLESSPRPTSSGSYTSLATHSRHCLKASCHLVLLAGHMCPSFLLRLYTLSRQEVQLMCFLNARVLWSSHQSRH